MPDSWTTLHDMSLYLKTIFLLRYPPTEQSSKCPGSHNNAVFEGRSRHSEGWGHFPPSPVPGAPCLSGVSESCWIVSAQILAQIFRIQFCLKIRLWESSSHYRGKICFKPERGKIYEFLESASTNALFSRNIIGSHLSNLSAKRKQRHMGYSILFFTFNVTVRKI